MVNLQKIDDSSVKFVFTDSDHYLVGNGEIVVPINSLSLVIDESEMVTFKKSATGDPFLSFRADNSNLGTKEAIEQFYKGNMVGDGGISQEEVQDMIDSATSGMPSSQVVEQLRTDVDTISGNTYTKTQIDGFLSNAEGMLTTISGEVQTNSANIQDIYDTIDEKEEVIASALTEVKQDINKKASVYYVDFWALFNDSYEMDDAKWNEMVEAYNNNAIFYVIPNDENQTASPLMVEYNSSDGNYIWFNIPYGNGYVSLTLNRIDSRDGYEYEVANAEEYYINVDDHLDSGSTNPVQNAVITQALDAKADASALTSIESAVTAVSNDLNTLSGAVIDNEYTVSQSLNDLNSRKLDISAYTPTDLSQYWTSAQTQSAIDEAKAYYISFATIATTGIRDEDWDGIVAAIDNHRPIYAGYPRNDGGILYYGVECMDKNSNNTQIVLTSSDDNSHYFYTFTKNGSNDYTFTSETRPYVTDAEKTAWNAKQDALSAGTGIEISGNVISAIGGGGATYSAGTNISIANDVISVNLPIEKKHFWNGDGISIIGDARGFSDAAYSTSIGWSNQISANNAHILGSYCEAKAKYSVALNANNIANAQFSLAANQNTTTNNVAEAAFGAYNNSVTGSTASGQTLFSVGNGTSSSARHNAFEIRQNGDIYVNDGTNDVKLQDTITATASNTTALGGLKLVKIYQADYDALATKDNDTLYIIPDGDSNNNDWEQ